MNLENKHRRRALTIREEFNRPKTVAYYREIIKRQEEEKRQNTPQYQARIARERIEDRAFDRAIIEHYNEKCKNIITFVPRKISETVSLFRPIIERAVSIKC